MKLYPKKLNSLADLEKEKLVLQKQMLELDKEDLFSLDGLMSSAKPGKKKKKKDDDDDDSSVGIAGLIAGLIPVSNPLIGLALKFAASRFDNRPAKSKKKRLQRVYEDEAPHKSIIKKAAFEFIGGYLKWKAIELSYKGIKHLINKSKAASHPVDPYAA